MFRQRDDSEQPSGWARLARRDFMGIDLRDRSQRGKSRGMAAPWGITPAIGMVVFQRRGHPWVMIDDSRKDPGHSANAPGEGAARRRQSSQRIGDASSGRLPRCSV